MPKIYDTLTGTHDLCPDNGGFQYLFTPHAGEAQLIPLSPDGARLIAWEILRYCDPGLLADPFARPELRRAVDAEVLHFPQLIESLRRFTGGSP